MNKSAERLYLLLGAVFIASLVACNLIFQKFFTWQPLSFLPEGFIAQSFTFELSVGIIAYPVTFLITDLISEIYGKARANAVVISGLAATLFVLILVLIAENSQATTWSPVDNKTFSTVFGLTGAGVGASMAAYLFAQFIDVRLFHFWKQLTKGKHLWLRNNFSTIFSQLVDTATVLLLLCWAGAIEWNLFWILFANGFLFKVLVALFDTPLFYVFTFMARKKFKLQPGEEILND